MHPWELNKDLLNWKNKVKGNSEPSHRSGKTRGAAFCQRVRRCTRVFSWTDVPHAAWKQRRETGEGTGNRSSMCRLGVHAARHEAAIGVTRSQAQGRKEMLQMRLAATRLILCSMWEPGMSTVMARYTKVSDKREMETENFKSVIWAASSLVEHGGENCVATQLYTLTLTEDGI